MRRDWSAARAKVDTERGCRICGSRDRVQAAHTIGRKYDAGISGPDGVVVQAVDVVPLCETHHQLYDKRAFDLLPYLSHEEQAAAVSHVGIVSAMRRLTSQH